MSIVSLLESENGPYLYSLLDGCNSGTLLLFDLDMTPDDSKDVRTSDSEQT